MHVLLHRLTSLAGSEDGTAATEYAIMLSLIVLGSVGACAALGKKIASVFDTVRIALSTS